MSRRGVTGSDIAEALRGKRPAWTEIDLDALAGNARLIRNRAGGMRRLLAVVKADAYGHGAVAVSRCLLDEKTEMLGVAIPEEGLELRRSGINAPVVVLGAADPSQIPQMVASSLIPTAYSGPFLGSILDCGHTAGRPVPFHLKIDTGMGRLGLQPGEVGRALDLLARWPDAATLEGVLTTLSCSDDPADPHTTAQMKLFGAMVEKIRAAGHEPRFVHAANSGGVIDHPASCLDTVRPGIMLYGLHPSSRSTRLPLEPVLSLKTRVMLAKRVPAGTHLGYGHAFTTTRPSLIGTLGAGYADGLSRRIWDRGHVLVRGARAPYVGRISMDHAMVDLSDIPGAAEGDEAVLLGRQGAMEIGADQLAAWEETIPYEVLCRIGARVHRLHIKDGSVQIG